MLETILGNTTAAKIMLYIFHYGEAYPSGVAKDMGIALSQVQKQLDKFENGAVLVSKKIGTVRVYRFNPKISLVKQFVKMIEAFYESIPLDQRETLFKVRRRPRRKGKPVL